MQTKYELNVELEDVSPVKKKLNIAIPAETVSREIKVAYQSLKSTAAVAGFRKGTVPLNILRARFAPHVEEDVTKKLIENSYPKALLEKEIVPVENPKIDIKNRIEDGKEFAYTVTVEVNPKVEVDGYRGMELKREAVEVTDKDVDEGIKNLRESRAQYKEVERPAKAGDLVIVDFEGFLDGAPVKNSKSADYPIILGEKTLLPGFDEALAGASKGENKDAKVTFPENYSEKQVAGKAADFKITVKTVKERVVPELDEEFAKDVDCENVEELKSRVRDEIKGAKEHNEKERLKNVILDELLKKHEFAVPESLVERYLRLHLNRVLENMRQGIVAPEDRELAPEALRAKYRAVAERQVKEDVILDAIAARENVEVSKEETEHAVRHLAEARNVTFEALMARIEREGALEIIKDGLKHEKVFEMILAALKAAA